MNNKKERSDFKNYELGDNVSLLLLDSPYYNRLRVTLALQASSPPASLVPTSTSASEVLPGRYQENRNDSRLIVTGTEVETPFQPTRGAPRGEWRTRTTTTRLEQCLTDYAAAPTTTGDHQRTPTATGQSAAARGAAPTGARAARGTGTRTARGAGATGARAVRRAAAAARGATTAE